MSFRILDCSRFRFPRLRSHHWSYGIFLILAMLTTGIAGCLSIQRQDGSSETETVLLPTTSGNATTTASAKAALAQHLANSGAKMYGTYWCPYCTRQKELFGQAVNQVPMIECDPNGANAQPNLCASANINGYPTWEIQGQQYRGIRSLEELAELSSYQGSRNFN